MRPGGDQVETNKKKKEQQNVTGEKQTNKKIKQC